MTYARKPYMDARRAARLASGYRQYSVWFTPQAWADLLAAEGARSVEATIADALRQEAIRAELHAQLVILRQHDEQATQ